MNLNESFRLKRGEEAVSPVVGVMLMLVVTIVIAAVVSAFAGGLATTTPKAPTLAMDISIASTGEPTDSHITFDVQSVSIPISTSHLKIITSWISASGISGGNTSEMGLNSPNVYTDDPWSFLYDGKQMSGQTVDQHQAPLGYGQGINGTQVSAGTIGMNQWFGNYTLVPGTSMQEVPDFAYYGVSSGQTPASGGTGPTSLYTYSSSEPTGWVDGMQAVLGGNWNALRPGDTVHVNIVDLQSGKTILSNDVAVTG